LEVVAQTRTGKQVLNLRDGAWRGSAAPVAAIMSPWWAKTARCWSFRWRNCPRWYAARACGLQKYKDGGLSDATTFALADGLSWKDPAGRTRTETRWPNGWASGPSAGRMAPRGFPRDNRFT
jgi:topoisomerase IV subunit A